MITMLLVFAVQIALPRYVVDGPSMEPTLLATQRIITVSDFVLGLAFWEESRYEAGDIVIFEPPEGFEQEIIKRVVAVEGDVVDIRAGDVYVNGELSAYEFESTEAGSLDYPLTVQPGAYFVLGDNRDDSLDSRAWGTIPEGDMVGALLGVYWPFADIKLF